MGEDPADSAEVWIGRTIAHFRIEGVIGRGGMGVVYRARDVDLRRAVALKLLPPEVVDDPIRRGRFLREARSAAAVTHPAIATVYEVGEHDEQIYIAMELVRGESLRDVVRAGRLPAARAARIAAGIAGALAVAHDAGIVHRDLKPANVMVTAGDGVKLLDFGLAKALGPKAADVAADVDADADTTLTTHAGGILGTPAYMAPEQVRGQPADARTDVFALGVLLYEMLAGRRPFSGDSVAELAVAILRTPPPPLDAELPDALCAIVDTCLAKDPAARYASAADAARDLEAVVDGGRAPAVVKRARVRPGRRWVWGALAVLVVGGGAVLGERALRSDTDADTDDGDGDGVGDGTSVLIEPRLTEARITRRRELPDLGIALSPDGSELVYATGEGTFVRSVTGGVPTKIEVQGDHDAIVPVDYFPDGARLLVRTIQHDRSRLAILDLDTRTLADPFEDTLNALWRDRIADARLSPTGAHIAFVDGDGVKLMAAGGGEVTDLVTLPKQHPGADSVDRVCALTWSPNGERVAFVRDRVTMGANVETTVEIVSRDRSTDVLRIDGHLVQALGRCGLEWLPDGRLVYALALDHTGAELWSVDPNAEAPAPQRLWSWPVDAVSGLRFAGGRLLYLRTHTQKDVYVAEVAEDGSLREPLRLTRDDGQDVFTGWTSDNRVLFTSPRFGTWDVFAQAPDGEEPPELIAGGDGAQVSAGAFGDDITYATIDMADRFEVVAKQGCHVMRLGRDGGPRELIEGMSFEATMAGREGPPRCRRFFGPPCALRAPVCAVQIPSDGDIAIAVIDPRAANPDRTARVVYRYPPENALYGIPTVSPDGRTIKLMTTSTESAQLALIDVATGDRRDVAGDFGGLTSNLFWRADGGGFYSTRAGLLAGDELALGRSKLVSIDLDGSEHVLWTTTDLISNPRGSPDGRWVAFVNNVYEMDVWMLEGLGVD